MEVHVSGRHSWRIGQQDLGAEQDEWQATKCAAFEKRSTKTATASFCLSVLGKWTIRSIVMCVHGRSGTGSGCKKPLGLLVWIFETRQVWQDLMYFSTCLCMLGQYATCESLVYVLSRPGCPANAESCTSCNRIVLASGMSGMHILSPSRK